jgi:hypothetical protein
MPAPLDAVLTATQRASLSIEKIIFHIIDPKVEGQVIFLDDVELEEKQKNFFLDRLRDIAEGTQYVFLPHATTLRDKCMQLVALEPNWNDITRDITQDFAGRHAEQMAAGLFVLAVVRFSAGVNDWQRLVLLVKLDKRPSWSYSFREDGDKRIAVMEEIQNALTESKAAVQKSAVIDISDYFSWDVLAYDRVQKPLLGDYYKKFLGVTERQQDSVLTRAAHDAVKRWASTIPQNDLPPGEDKISYTGRAFNYLNDHTTFETEEFLNAVLKDQDSERKAAFTVQLQAVLADAGIAGQQFMLRPESISKRASKQIYQTAEGVTITFQGDKDAAGLTIQEKPGGGRIVTIETHKLTIKS